MVAGCDTPPPQTKTLVPESEITFPGEYAFSGTTVHIVPSVALAEVNVPIVVTVAIAKVPEPAGLGGFEFALTYDPAAVWVEGVEMGEFLASTGRVVTPTVSAIDNVVGSVTVRAESQGSTPPGPTGEGSLAHVSLLPHGLGMTSLQLAQAHATNVYSQPLTIFIQSTTLSVVPGRVRLPLVLLRTR